MITLQNVLTKKSVAFLTSIGLLSTLVLHLIPLQGFPREALAAVDGGASSNIQLKDNNTNGKFNRISFDILNPSGDTWTLNGASPFGLAVTQNGNDITINTVTIVGSPTAAAVRIRIDLDENDTDLVVDTNGVSSNPVELSYTQTAGGAACTDCIRDTDEQLNTIVAGDDTNATNTETDAAVPVITNFRYEDNDGDAMIDQFTVGFSESLNASSVLSANDLLLTDDGDFDGAAFGNDGTDLLTGGETSVVVALGTPSTTLDTFDNSGTLAVSTSNSFSLTDGSNTNSTLVAQTQATFSDGAAPAPVTARVFDSNVDGMLDLITVTWSEDITAVADASADFAISSAADFAGLSEGTVECNNGGAAANECDYNFTTTTLKTDIGDLTLDYTGVTTGNNFVNDGTNNAFDVSFDSASSVPLSDRAVPLVTALALMDSDENGSVDQIDISYSEPLGDTAMGANGFDITSATNHGTCTSEDADPDGTNMLSVTFSCTGFSTAIGDLTLDFTANAGVIDNADNQSPTATFTSASTPAITDMAAPVIQSQNYQDTNFDGTVDTLALTFSEIIATNAAIIGDFSYTGNDIGGSLNANPGNTGSATITLTITGANAFTTSHATVPTIAYTFTSGALADAAANQAVDFTAQDLVDMAAAAFVSATANSDTNILITMSESLSMVTFGAANAWTATGITSTAAAINGGDDTKIDLTVNSLGNTAFTAADLAFSTANGGVIADMATVPNTTASFSGKSITDGQAPTFVSAVATSDTNIRITMSEALNSVTFGAAADWTATGFTSSAAAINGGDNTKIDLTVSSLGNTAFTANDFAFDTANGGDIQDSAGNSTAPFTGQNIGDAQAPTLTTVSIASNNANFTTLAKVGDTVTVSFTASESLNFGSIAVSIDGNAADSINNLGGNNFSATRVMQSGDTEAPISFTIDFNDSNANVGAQVTSTTDASSVTSDQTAPAGYSVSFDQAFVNNANQTSISFTFAAAEVGATYNFSVDDTNIFTNAVTGSGTIATATDQITGIDLSSLIEGTLTLSVTLTDPAGNTGTSATDTISKDTAAPTISARLTKDQNTNGIIDEITFITNEPLNDNFTGITIAVTGFTVTGIDTGTTANDSSFRVTLQENGTCSAVTQTGCNTSARPNTRITANTTLADAAGNNINTDVAAVQSSDGASPVMLGATTLDNNNDGTADFVRVLYSESLDDTTVSASDFQVGIATTAAGNLSETFSSGTPSSGNQTDVTDDNKIFIGVSSATETLLANKTDYTLMIEQVSGVSDLNINTLASFAPFTSADGAKPIALSASYFDANGNGQIDRADIFFTEPVTYTYQDSDFGITANGLTGFDVTACASCTSVTTIQLSATASTNLTGVSAGTEPSISHTPGNTFADGTGNTALGFTINALTDSAAPIITTRAYQDNSGDGSVDRAVIGFTEFVNYNGNDISQFGITANNLTGFSSATSLDSGSGSASLTLSTSATTDLTGVSGGTEPTLQYTQSVTPGNRVNDGKGNDLSSEAGASALADQASPIRIGIISYTDIDNDGQIDRTDLSYSENITYSYQDGDWTAVANGLTNYDVTACNSCTNTSSLMLVSTANTNLTGVSAGVEPTLAYTVGNAIADDSGNNAGSFTAVTLVDRAEPISMERKYNDNGNNGSTDRIVIVFTEFVNYNGNDLTQFVIDNQSLTNFDSDGTPNALVSGNGTNTLRLRTSGTTDLTGVSGLDEPTVQYTRSGTSGNRVNDGKGNDLPSDVGAVSLTDNADPLILTRNYLDNGANGSVDRLRLTFTEAVNYNGNDTNQFGITANDLTGYTSVESLNSGSGTSTLVLNTSATTNLTGVSGGTEPTLQYTQSVTSNNRVSDASNNRLQTEGAATSINDLAIPVRFGTIDYQDINGDGQIDRTEFVYTENVFYTYQDTDFVATANDLSGFDVTACDSCTDVATVQLTSTANANLTGVSGGTEPTLAYTAGNSFADANGNNASNFGATSLNDLAAPVRFGTIDYRDVNNDGQIDRTDFVYTENVFYTYQDTDFVATANDLSGFDVTACDSCTNVSTLMLTSTASTLLTGVSGGTEPTLAYTAGNNITDANSNNAANFGAINLNDLAEPILTGTKDYLDINGDGQIDRTDIGYTENVFYTYQDTDFVATSNDLTGYDVTACTSCTNVSTLQLTSTANAEITGVSGGTEPTLAYTAGNNISDANGNNAFDYAGMLLNDLAAPVRIGSIDYQDINGDGQIDRTEFVYTENVFYTYQDTDFVATANDLSGFDVTACDSCTDVATVQLTSTANANLTGVSGGTEPTLAYTAGNSFADANGNNASNFGATSLNDVASPVRIGSIDYQDINGDGQIDRTEFVYTENVFYTYQDTDFVATANDLSGFDVTACDSCTDVATVQLTSTANANLTGVSGGTEPTLAYTAGNSFADANGNNASNFGATSLNDVASPVQFGDVEYFDTDLDGQIDKVSFDLTEQVSYVFQNSDLTETANDLTGFDLTGCMTCTSTSTLEFSATADTNLTGVGAGTEPAFSFTPGNNISDLNGNNANGFTINSLVDSASPLITNTAPADASLLNNTNVSFTLSETVQMGTVTWTNVGGSADAGSPRAQALSGMELVRGDHFDILLANAPALVDGGIYDIDFLADDFNANTSNNPTQLAIEYDFTRPSLIQLDVNMDTPALTLTFDEIVDVGTITDLTIVSLDDSGTPTLSYTLTDSTLTTAANSDIIVITLSTTDVNALRTTNNLYNLLSNTFISFPSTFVDDLAGNNVNDARLQATTLVGKLTNSSSALLRNRSTDTVLGATSDDQIIDPNTGLPNTSTGGTGTGSGSGSTGSGGGGSSSSGGGSGSGGGGISSGTETTGDSNSDNTFNLEDLLQGGGGSGQSTSEGNVQALTRTPEQLKTLTVPELRKEFRVLLVEYRRLRDELGAKITSDISNEQRLAIRKELAALSQAFRDSVRNVASEIRSR